MARHEEIKRAREELYQLEKAAEKARKLGQDLPNRYENKLQALCQELRSLGVEEDADDTIYVAQIDAKEELGLYSDTEIEDAKVSLYWAEHGKERTIHTGKEVKDWELEDCREALKQARKVGVSDQAIEEIQEEAKTDAQNDRHKYMD